MSMITDTAVQSGLPPHKRRTSFSGFLSKILPANRSEQGGTARIQDVTGDSDSAYADLNMNPNDLTEWNLAQERPQRPQGPEASARTQHDRSCSRGTQEGYTQLRGDIGQILPASYRIPMIRVDRSSQRPESPSPKPPSQAQHEGPRPMTREEIRNMLAQKEDTRKHRRSLKESGDWLGVQGADPYSGEFAVLTPTSTLSSETTSPSTRWLLATLSQRQEAAKLAYDKAKWEEDTEREKALLQKDQSKLEKMESVKKELRQQQHELPIWSQHKRRWSSTAEPDLSPIPQSPRSRDIDSSCDEITPAAIRNFSRPSKSSGGSIIDDPKLVGASCNSENTEPPKRNLRRDPSTETIVHKSVPNMESPIVSTNATGILHPSVIFDADELLHREQKKKGPFLSRHRRGMVDPEKLVRHPNFRMNLPSAGKTENSLVSDSNIESHPPVPQIQPRLGSKDRCSDLLRPAYTLSPGLYTEKMATTERSLIPMKRDPSPVASTGPTPNSHSEAQSRPALTLSTNLWDYQVAHTVPPRAISDVRRATATSSQSKQKGNTKPPLTYPRLIPSRNSSFQASPARVQASQIQNNSGQAQNHTDPGLYVDMLRFQHTQQWLTPGEGLGTVIVDHQPEVHTSEQYKKDQGEFAFTPTIITTGFDLNPQPPMQPCIDLWEDGEDSAAGSDVTPAPPSSQSSEEAIFNNGSVNGREEGTAISSRPTTPQSSSQSSVLSRETPDIDTVSINYATSRSGSASPAGHVQTSSSCQSLKDGCMKRAKDKPQVTGFATPPRQRYDKTLSRESKAKTAGLLHHRRGSGEETARPRRVLGEHEEVMIREAARIAMQRSRAKTVITGRTGTPTRTPSPPYQDAQEAKRASPSPKRNGGGDGAETDIPYLKIGSLDAPPPSQLQVRGLQQRSAWNVAVRKTKKGHTGGDLPDAVGRRRDGIGGNSSKPGALVTFVSLLITVYMMVLGVACAWWVMVKPAFDQRSQFWRRRRGGAGTWRDVGVLAAAVMFCATGALIITCALHTGLWIILKLWDCEN